VSDSFNGTIWKIPPQGGSFSAWLTDPLLGPGTGLTPPFGANGVEFSNDFSTMYVANTAFHQIIQIPVTHNNGALVAGTPSILTTGINAPDGILVDRKGNIWICANQEDEIVVIDPKGGTNPLNGQKIPKVIAELGDFGGIDENRHRPGLFVPGEPGVQPGRQDALCLEPDTVPALCGRECGDRFTVDAAGPGLCCRSRAIRCPKCRPSCRRSPTGRSNRAASAACHVRGAGARPALTRSGSGRDKASGFVLARERVRRVSVSWAGRSVPPFRAGLGCPI
jgi:hypothetical protein